MPGLFGYTDQNGAAGGDAVLTQMRDLLIYTDKPHKSEPFFHHENNIHAGYCAPDVWSVDDRTAENDGVYCWFDGEIYNADELTPLSARSSSIITGHAAKNLLIGAYKNGSLHSCLRKIDGYFSAVIYDREKKQVSLMTDRHGFRHIYYTVVGKNLFWASEYKAFLRAPGFKIDINRQSVEEFMRGGILREDRTWLNGVYLLDGAAVLQFDITTCATRKDQYYYAGGARPSANKFDMREYCEEWGRLFKTSVKKRTCETERTGLLLSGGLDSRAILAAMPLDGSRINTVTLGDPRCDDAKIAAVAARVKGARHQVFPLEKDGWLERAFNGVWATDGALNIGAATGFEHLGAFSKLFDVNMTGMGGGVMQGGMEPGAQIYDADRDSDTGLVGLNMRNRRFICPGCRLDESFFKLRIPYYDNNLYEFTMSVPREIRQKGVIVNKALLHNFSQYYKTIPWQKTGVPIGWHPLPFAAAAFFNRVASRVKRKLQKFNLPVYDSKLFFNSTETLDHVSNRTLAQKILSDKNAVWPDYVSKDLPIVTIHKYANQSVERKCRLLTFEIFMRQIMRGDFRPR